MSHSVGDSMPFVLECVSCFRMIRLISLSGLAAIGMAIIVIPTAEAVAAVQDQSIEISARQQGLVRSLSSVRQSLLKPEDESNFNKKISRQYKTLLSQGPNLSATADKEVMTQGLRYRIYRATDPQVQASPFLMGQALLDIRRELNSCGSLILNKSSKERFREEVMVLAHGLLLDLLKNNLDARMFALAILNELEIRSKGPDQPRTDILGKVPETLQQVISDADAKVPDAVRAAAAVQVRKFLEKTDALPVVQMQLGSALRTQLARTDTEVTYQKTLIEALCRVSWPREIVGQATPSVFDALLKVVADPKRDISVRCMAARGFGRIGYDSEINFDVLAWKVAQLAVQAGEKFNEDPGNPEFPFCGSDLYLAFHHLDADEAKDPKNIKGMLNRAPRSTVVKDAYQLILKIVGPMLAASGEPIPAEDLQAVKDWTEKNVPADLKFDAAGIPVPK
jgi:hypothetical protein